MSASDGILGRESRPGRASEAQRLEPGKTLLTDRRFVAAGLLLLAFGAYWPIIGNRFGSDDPLFLNNAQHVLADPSALFTERVLLFFRPLFQLWVTLLYSAFGTEPRGYFVAAIVLHAAGAYALWRVALRLLLRPVAALAAAVAFTVLFSPSGALLWMAAHSSVLVCTLAIAALWSHIDGCLLGGRWRFARTVALVLAMLLSKESGLLLLAWLPLAEWRVRGLRSCFQPESLRRYAVLAVVAALYLLIHPRFILEGLAETPPGAAPPPSALRYATLSRIFGASAWLYSPLEHRAKDLMPWLGVLTLVAPVGLTALLAPARLRDALFFGALLLVAMPSSCSLVLLQTNGSRLYDLPAIGAALSLGLLVAVAEDVAERRRAATLGHLVVGVLVLLFVVVNVRAIQARNERDYGPDSLWQQHAERFTDLYQTAGAAGDSAMETRRDPEQEPADEAFVAELLQRLRSQPDAAARLGQLLAERRVDDATASAVVAALGAEDAPWAQECLRTIALDASNSHATRVAAIAALGGPAAVEQASLEALWILFAARSSPEARDLSSRAALALGDACRNLSRSAPERAAALRRELLAALQACPEATGVAALLMALGRTADPEAAAAIAASLESPEALVRSSAARALRRLGAASAAPALAARLLREDVPAVRTDLASALAALASDDPGVLRSACDAVSGLEDEQARFELVAWLVHHVERDPLVRQTLDRVAAGDASARIRELLARTDLK